MSTNREIAETQEEFDKRMKHQKEERERRWRGYQEQVRREFEAKALREAPTINAAHAKRERRKARNIRNLQKEKKNV